MSRMHTGEIADICRRTPFRDHSLISNAMAGIVAGLGAGGYELALGAMSLLLPGRRKQDDGRAGDAVLQQI